MRQIAFVDAEGRVGAHTGEKCIENAGHHTGAGYSVQANMMGNAEVVPSMARAYEGAKGDLAERLMVTLEAAQKAGGDIRGCQSAAILVVRGKRSDKPWADKIFDLRVDDSPDPIGELRRLVKLARAYDHMNRGDVAVEKQDMKAALEHYGAAAEMTGGDSEMLYWQAVALAANGQVDRSIPIFRRVFADDPRWIELTRRLHQAGPVARHSRGARDGRAHHPRGLAQVTPPRRSARLICAGVWHTTCTGEPCMSELAAPPTSEPVTSVPAPFADGWTYLGRAVTHPSGTMVLFLGICIGTWIGGPLGLVIGLLGSLGLVASGARSPAFRSILDSHLVARERRRRDLERERRLLLAGPLRRAQFAELSALVEEIEDHDAGQAERLELQDLLEYYIAIAIGHQRMVEAVQRADRAPLWEAGAARIRAEVIGTSRQRQDILARRVRHRDACRNRAAQLADELDAIAEFLHLVNEMSSCPLLEAGVHRELERRLWELEAQESAMRQLDAA